MITYCLKEKIFTPNLFEKLKKTRNGKYYIEAICKFCSRKKTSFVSKETYLLQKEKQKEKEKQMFDIGLVFARKRGMKKKSRPISNISFSYKNKKKKKGDEKEIKTNIKHKIF